METVKFNKKLIISCILVFIFALFLRLHFISLKQGLHGDEVFSINLSNVSNYGCMLFYPQYKTYKGIELKKLSLYDNEHFSDSIEDLKKLHKNTFDPPHTNLYYSVLRLWFSGFTDTNMHSIIWRGCSLNLIFFCLSFFIMYKILRRFFEDNALIPFGLLVAFANTGTISNTLFMRPYQLQETIFLLLTLIVINFWKDIENNNFLTAKSGIVGTVVLGLTLLTGYLAPFYIGLLGILLVFKSVKEKQLKNILFLFLYFILALLFAWCFYLSYFNGFVSDRAQGVAAENIYLNLNLIKAILSNFIYYFYYPCNIVLFGALSIKLFFTKTKLNISKLCFLIFICAILWTAITMIVVPYKVIRYIFPIIPIMCIVFPMLLAQFKGKEKNLYIGLFSIIFAFNSLFPNAVESYDTKYPRTKKLFPGQSRIQNLFLTQKQIYPFVNEPQLPVYIAADNSLDILELVPLFNDNQIYYITYEKMPIPINIPSFYMLLDNKKEVNMDLINKFYYIEYEIQTERRLRILKLIHK